MEETPNSAEKGGSVRPPDQSGLLMKHKTIKGPQRTAANDPAGRNPGMDHRPLAHRLELDDVSKNPIFGLLQVLVFGTVNRGNFPRAKRIIFSARPQEGRSRKPAKKMPETQAPSLEKEATTMHLLSRDILFLPKKLYQCRLIVLIRKTIFLFVSAERTPVNELPFTLFEKCRDRLHQSAAGSKTVPGMYIDVPTPETLGTMIGIAIPPHLRSAPPAHEILNPFLKCFGRHIPHSFKKKQVRQPRRAPAPK